MARIFGQYVLADMVVLWVFETLTCFGLLLAATWGVAVAGPTQAQLLHVGATDSAVLAVALSLSCLAVGLYRPGSFLSATGMLLPMAAALVPLALLAGLVTVPVVWALAVVQTIDFGAIGNRPLWLAGIGLSWVALVLATRLVYALCIRSGMLVRDVLVLGAGDEARRTIEAVGRLRSGLLRILDAGHPVASAIGPRRPGPLRIVLATDGGLASPLPEGWAGRFTQVIDARTFWERHLGRVDLEGLGTRTIAVRDARAVARFARRAIDVTVASLLLVLLAPVLAATAVAIRLESPGPLIYRQERIGVGGRSFTILKFRSMRSDAERDGVAMFAMLGDTRTTAVGRLIRKVRIDELPQLVNILRGDMSVVGPRPERPAFVERYRRTIPNYDLRHTVRPGLTGWAQVNCPYAATDAETREKLSYDLYYVRHRSLALDFATMVSTIRVILFQVGAR